MKRTVGAALAVAAMAAATALAQDLPEGFTCCNLHYDGDWISDANWGTKPVIPAGAAIKVVSFGSNRASVEIDGQRFRIGHDYGRAEESLERFIGKLVVKDDPRRKIATWPAEIREAVRMGKLARGMTREQVIVAAGYPPTHQTRTLEAPTWRYWNHRYSSYTVTFDEKGLVREVNGQQ